LEGSPLNAAFSGAWGYSPTSEKQNDTGILLHQVGGAHRCPACPVYDISNNGQKNALKIIAY
jgi:hypothetical protein